MCSSDLEKPALAEDERFAGNARRLENRVELEALIESEFGGHTRAEISSRLQAAEIAWGAVNDVAAVATHPQLWGRHRWAQVETEIGLIPALLPPHNLKDAPPSMGAVPALGQHTKEILKELAKS